MLKLDEIGIRIKKLREKTGLTQSKLASFLSLDQSMIAKIEKGERNINSDMLEKISNLFYTTTEYILFGKNVNENITVAFRGSKLDAKDLEKLEKINRIVLNQFEMDKINGRDLDD